MYVCASVCGANRGTILDVCAKNQPQQKLIKEGRLSIWSALVTRSVEQSFRIDDSFGQSVEELVLFHFYALHEVSGN
jgi:hypothetical protein